MKKIALSILLALCQIAVFAQPERETLLVHYLKVKDALVESDSKAASDAAAKLLSEVSGLQGQPTLVKAVTKLAKQTELEKQRIAFAKVSIIAWKIAKSSEPFSQSLYYQYCPMKGMYWVSNEPAIRNPYYGSQMLDCGKVVDQKLK